MWSSLLRGSERVWHQNSLIRRKGSWGFFFSFHVSDFFFFFYYHPPVSTILFDSIIFHVMIRVLLDCFLFWIFSVRWNAAYSGSATVTELSIQPPESAVISTSCSTTSVPKLICHTCLLREFSHPVAQLSATFLPSYQSLSPPLCEQLANYLIVCANQG